MANGENRAKIKASVDKTGQSIEEGAEALGQGIKRVTLNIGKGLTSFGKGTVDAIINPHTIPEKLETNWDKIIVQPTRRTVDFLEETSSKVLNDTDRLFNEKVKKAQENARHLKVVFAQPLDITGMGSYTAPKYPKSDEDNLVIETALQQNFVFNGLPDNKRSTLVNAFEPIIVKHGTTIITEGDVGDYFYVVGNGEVTFTISTNEVGSAGPGSSFGELALLYNAPRAATCVAKTQCGLFRLDQQTFRRIMAQQMEDSHKDVINVLKMVTYFKDFDEATLNKIANNLKVINYEDGHVLASREGDSKDDFPKRFYIIKEGSVEVKGIQAGGADYKDITIGPGKFFGEMAIMENEWGIGKATAKGKVVALTLDRGQFIKVLGNDIQALVQKGMDKKCLALVPFGKRKNPASENELDLLAGAIKEKTFPKGHVFFTEGKKSSPALYLIRDGLVNIRSANHPNLESLLGFSLGSEDVKTIGRHGYFGNDTMGANEKGEFGLAQYTVTALEEVKVGVLDFAAIKSVVAQSQVQEKIGLDDLDMIRILGAGTFGKVWLVTKKGQKDDAYALKVQVKKQLIEYNQAEGVIREKNIMAKLDHPFIIKMVSHWKDDEKLYMLLKMYQGGELQTVIHTDTRDGIPEWAAKFYAANMLEGLSYMHHRHIIYRDLKPENVLLDSEGYTIIIDLGFAKIIKDKTYTFCGTPLYLAPEIIMQKGHNAGADHWSWGVMIYEMIVGMTPFYDGIVDQMGLFKNIVKCRMEFPEGDFMSASSKDLIKRMLTVNPNDRLGSFAGADKDIKDHPFFEGIDWVKLANKEVKVPFKPKVSDPLDGSNFDDYSKLEAKEKKAKHAKLTAAEQKLFTRF